MKPSLTELLATRSIIYHKVNQGISLSELHKNATAELEVMSQMLFEQNLMAIVEVTLRNDPLAHHFNAISESSHSQVHDFNGLDLINLAQSNAELIDRNITFFQAISSLSHTIRTELSCSDKDYLSKYNRALSRIDAVTKCSLTPPVGSTAIIEDEYAHTHFSNDLVVITIKATGNIHAISNHAYIIITNEHRINFIKTQANDNTEKMVSYISYPTEDSVKNSDNLYGIIIYNDNKESYSLVPSQDITIDNKIVYMVNLVEDDLESITYQEMNTGRNGLRLNRSMLTWNDELIGLIIHTYISAASGVNVALPGTKLFDGFSEKTRLGDN